MGREIVLTFKGVDTTTPAVAPTCTEPGWTEGHHCNVCGTDYGCKQIPALGHSYKEIERLEPANGADGHILYECEHCKEQKKETIPWTEEPTETSEPPKIE